MATLKDSLSRSGASYAKRALEAYVQEDYGNFAVFGGFAVEHAVKAKLANINPAFLAPRGDFFQSAMSLDRAADSVERLPSGVRTVGAMEAVNRLMAVEPEHRPVLSASEDLFAARNGQVHLGIHDKEQAKQSFAIFLRCINALLNIDPSEFWDPHQALVSTVLDETAQAIEAEVKARMSAAHIRYNTMLTELAEGQLETLVRVAESHAEQNAEQADQIEAVVISCPVCKNSVLVEGDTEETDYVVDYDDGVPSAAWPILTFFPSAMHCQVCGLILEDSEDFEAAGIGESWENEDVDLDVWFSRIHEPDPYW